MCSVQFYLWYVSISFGKIFSYLLATFSSEAELYLIVNPLAPSMCNHCTWNLPKQLKAFKLGERFLTWFKLGEIQKGELIQVSCTERAIVAGSERPYEVVDGGILVATIVEYKTSCGN
jgi:hypothetical protein